MLTASFAKKLHRNRHDPELDLPSHHEYFLMKIYSEEILSLSSRSRRRLLEQHYLEVEHSVPYQLHQ